MSNRSERKWLLLDWGKMIIITQEKVMWSSQLGVGADGGLVVWLNACPKANVEVTGYWMEIPIQVLRWEKL